MKKLFGGINLTWKKIIILAIVCGIYTGIMAMLPLAKDTSFSDLSVTFEVWILFGILIIINSKTPIDSALKCFIFFLISQPLVYLIQVPFSHLGWQLFNYYSYWFIWTIATLPMGYIGWYLKKDKWWGLLILVPIMVLLGYHFNQYLEMTMFSFPRHFLTVLFCVITMFLYPLVIFKDKKIKIVGSIIGVIILACFAFITLKQPNKYETDILINGGSTGAVFDDSYKVYLTDDSYGKVEIKFINQGLDDWVVHATFIKSGDTEVILESSKGEQTKFDINIGRDTYTINKK